MKRITINKGKIALRFKKGDYIGFLEEGTYWIPFSNRIQVYDRSSNFNPSIDIDLLLRDEQVKELMDVVEVSHKEIAVMYVNDIFRQILPTGRYIWWKSDKKRRFEIYDTSEILISEALDKELLNKSEFSPWVRKFSIESYEKGLLYVEGKLEKELVPGQYLYWNNSTPVQVKKIDIRQQQVEISGQEILSKDKAALRINFFAQYRIVDIKKALVENKEYDRQLYILLQLALREYLGAFHLDELLEKKESISASIIESIKEKVKSLGIEVVDCGIRDIILPGEVKEIMNQVLIAQKKAQANIITRREETASTRSLLNTAKLMEENEMLFKLKEMEYVEKIADKINTISLSGGGQVVQQLKEIFSVSSEGKVG